jgi:hypothetical protein
MDNQFTGFFVRQEIAMCGRLTIKEKYLLAVIDSLDTPDRGCYASNKYLSEIVMLPQQTVANMITDLRKKGILQSVSEDIRRRGLRVFVPCSNKENSIEFNEDTLTAHSKGITTGSNSLTAGSKGLTTGGKADVTTGGNSLTADGNTLTAHGNDLYHGRYNPLPPTVTDIIDNIIVDNKEIYSESKKSEPIDDTDWMQVAKAMIEYAKGEGKNQWSFMAGMYNYQEEPDKLISLWCSKAQPYDLKNWKKNFRNLTTWIKNEAQNTFRSVQATEKKEEKPVRDCGYPIYDPKTMKGLRVDCLKMEIDGLPWYVDCDYKPICIVEEWRHRYEL